MPPPSFSSKVSKPSEKDQDSICDNESSKTDPCKSLCRNRSQPNLRRETVKFMRTFLGPSLEDSVLKTLEFGKTIISKPDSTKELLPSLECCNENNSLDVFEKELTECSEKDNIDINYFLQEGKKIMKEQKSSKRKSVSFKNKTEKTFAFYQTPFMKKLSNVSKIRSLDSDLKQEAPSPEKIKRQLEDLIEINKTGVQKSGDKWNFAFKAPKFPVEMTVMPSLCMYKNQADINTCDTPSNASRQDSDCRADCSRVQENSRNQCPSKICQAPEFISNALGPTIDVTIIDNLKMMRDIFKSDSGKGEGGQKQPLFQANQEVRLQNSEMEMSCRIEELQKKIEELEHKEQCLTKQIEDEEHERQCKRKAFEEEERKISAVRSCFDKMPVSSKRGNGEVCVMEGALEDLKMKIACEEMKLLKLKNQNDIFKKEIAEVMYRKESAKRNKSLLDAWDVFASRVCHTRLPSFSKASCLERKYFKGDDFGNLHCCFPLLSSQKSPEGNKHSKICPSQCESSETRCSTRTKCRSRSRSPSNCNNCRKSSCEVQRSCSKESQSNFVWKIKMGEIPFPVQRDVFCGLHQVLKTCTCKVSSKKEGHLCSSEDDLIRKFKTMKSKCDHTNSFKTLNIKADKKICRSKSDTSIKVNRCPRIVKVMWATTRINVFHDNSRTYEVMDATSRPPSCLPVRTEGIFVVKNPQKKLCQDTSTEKNHCASGY